MDKQEKIQILKHSLQFLEDECSLGICHAIARSIASVKGILIHYTDVKTEEFGIILPERLHTGYCWLTDMVGIKKKGSAIRIKVLRDAIKRLEK